MAEIFKFFNSAPGDERWHYASDFADYFGDVLSSGLIHKDNVPGMQVTVVANSLKTKVAPGQGLIKGYSYQNTTSLELTHDITEVGLNRIDRIVLRLDLRNANRYIKLFVKKGTEAVTPIAPELQRDNYIYELSLAQVKVTSNSTIISPLSLVDERLKEELCGVVHSLISVPTSVFQQQFDVWFNAQKELYEADLATWTSSQKLSFNQWLTQQQHDWGIWRDEQNESFIDWQNSEKQIFYDWLASLQTILSGDVAGNLALMITNHIDSNMHIYDATVSYVDGLYTLTTTKTIDNSYVTLRFKAPNVYQDGDKFKVGNDTYTATNVDFNENDIVMINFDKANLLACGVTTTLQIPLPAQVNTFTATGGDKTANLAWTNSNTANLEDYLIVYKVGSIPASPTDGTRLIVAKTATSTTVTGLTNNSTYYFRIYPRNSKKQLQKIEKTANVTPIGGLLLNSLPVGAKVKDVNTRYGGQVIVWIVASQNHYAQGQTVLVAEKILTLKAFDTSEANNSNPERANFGNNYYRVSNIRQWLNSAYNSWYTAQHSADAPPTNALSWGNYNEYDSEYGFLTNFSESFRNALISTAINLEKGYIDGTGTETIRDKIFLLSSMEVGLEITSEGKTLELFTSDTSRIGYPTTSAVSRSEYKDGISASTPIEWFLRTRDTSSYYKNLTVHSKGVKTISFTQLSKIGIRPALNISSSTIVSQVPDSDGAYTILW